MCQLRNLSAVLHIRCIASSAKYAADLHLIVGVVGGDERARRIIDQGSQLYWYALESVSSASENQCIHAAHSLFQGSFERWNDVLALYSRNVKTLCPSL